MLRLTTYACAFALFGCGGGTPDADAGPDSSVECSSDVDCDDGDTCNGDEICNFDSECEPGEPADDGTECGDGFCVEGECVATPCEADGDCDDGDVCNGAEVCRDSGFCGPGMTVSCDDGNSCTHDTCNPASGCSSVVIDDDADGHSPTNLGACGTDCDDTMASVSPDATSDPCNTYDDDCDGMIDEDDAFSFYADCDQDDYAASGAAFTTACVEPLSSPESCDGGGWTMRAPTEASSTDCDDTQFDVHPEQSEAYYVSPIEGRGAADDYDYDCSGAEEQLYPDSGECSGIGVACTLTRAGWTAGPIPACGASGMFLTNCEPSALGCTPVIESRQQACH